MYSQGYRSYADLALETSAVGGAAGAQRFLAHLASNLQPYAAAALDELRHLSRPPAAAPPDPWSLDFLLQVSNAV